MSYEDDLADSILTDAQITAEHTKRICRMIADGSYFGEYRERNPFANINIRIVTVSELQERWKSELAQRADA